MSSKDIAKKVMSGMIVLNPEVMRFMQNGVASPLIQQLIDQREGKIDSVDEPGNFRLARIGAKMAKYIDTGYINVYVRDDDKPDETPVISQRYNLTERLEYVAKKTAGRASIRTGNDVVEMYKEKFARNVGYPWNDFFKHTAKASVGYGECFSRVVDLAELGSTDAIVMDTWLTDPSIDAFDAMYFVASLIRGTVDVSDNTDTNDTNDTNVYTKVKAYAKRARSMTWREVVNEPLTGNVRQVILPVMLAVVAAHTPVLKDPVFRYNANAIS